MSDFGIQLDDDLLSAALEAVEKVEKKSRAPRPVRDDAPDDDAEIQVELDEGAPVADDDALDIELDVDLDELAEQAADALKPDDGPAADTGREAELRAELDAARAELAAARKHARALDQENGRLKGTVRRLKEQASRTQAQIEQARQARKTADEQRRTVRDRNHELKKELEHLRERRRRERDEDRSYGHQRTVEVFLPVLDNLELALEHQAGDAARVVQGVQMILQQFHQALSQLGVQRVVSGEGVLFDPEVHEAISEVRTDELLPGSIVAELRPGYALNGRLLRASRVTVAAPEGAEPQPASDTPEAGSGDTAGAADADTDRAAEPSTDAPETDEGAPGRHDAPDDDNATD